MSMLKEFKEFAVRGNVVDLAVAVIIGAAFGKIVTSLVTDVVMPPIGYALGGLSVSGLFYDLSNGQHATLEAAREAGAATINYGLFLQSVFDFLIIALVIFMVVKMINRLRRQEEVAPAVVPSTKSCPACLSSIPMEASRCAFCTGAVA